MLVQELRDGTELLLQNLRDLNDGGNPLAPLVGLHIVLVATDQFNRSLGRLAEVVVQHLLVGLTDNGEGNTPRDARHGGGAGGRGRGVSGEALLGTRRRVSVSGDLQTWGHVLSGGIVGSSRGRSLGRIGGREGAQGNGQAALDVRDVLSSQASNIDLSLHVNLTTELDGGGIVSSVVLEDLEPQITGDIIENTLGALHHGLQLTAQVELSDGSRRVLDGPVQVLLTSDGISVVSLIQEGIQTLVDVGHRKLEETGSRQTNRHGVTLAVDILFGLIENLVLKFVEGLSGSDAAPSADIRNGLHGHQFHEIVFGNEISKGHFSER